MAKEIMLVKEGIHETGYVGFSWTMFFFGFWVPLVRKDYKIAIILMTGRLLSEFFERIFLITPLLSEAFGRVITLDNEFWFTIGRFWFIINLINCFWYNKYYTKNLIKKGFVPETEDGKKLFL